MLPQPRARTFRSVLLRAFVPRLVALAAAVAALGTGQAVGHVGVAGGPASADVAVIEQVAPAWTMADVAAFPGCVSEAMWPAGAPATGVVVAAARDSRHRRIGFDRAWRLNHNAAATDDLRVVGICR